MQYCNGCAKKHGWPLTITSGHGFCELCSKLAFLNVTYSKVPSVTDTRQENGSHNIHEPGEQLSPGHSHPSLPRRRKKVLRGPAPTLPFEQGEDVSDASGVHGAGKP